MSWIRLSTALIIMWVCGLPSMDGQEDSLLLINSQPVMDGRYADIKGDPFLFKEPVKARIIRNDANVFENVYLNYNGFSKELEVMNGGQMIELDRSWYLRVEVPAAENPGIADQIIGDKLILQRGIHNKFRDQFTILLFVGDDLFLIKDFDVEKRTNTVNDVGKTVEFEKFTARDHYYLKRRGKLTQIRLKKKSVIDALDSPEVEKYIKDNKLKCTTEQEIVQVLEYFNGIQ